MCGGSICAIPGRSDISRYSISVALEGRPVLVVGGGAVATRKAEGLLAAGAQVSVIAPQISAELRAIALSQCGAGAPVQRCGTLELEQRSYREGDCGGKLLVIAATADRQVNFEIGVDATRAGAWVNVVDDVSASTFIVPAILRRGPLSVAVSTDGGVPGMAGWLRDQLAQCVGPEYGDAAAMLTQIRSELKSSGTAPKLVDWQSALESDMLDMLRAGQIDRAKELLRRCLSL